MGRFVQRADLCSNLTPTIQPYPHSPPSSAATTPPRSNTASDMQKASLVTLVVVIVAMYALARPTSPHPVRGHALAIT